MEVLLADDEVMARILLKELLAEQDSRFGVRIAGEAENGEELLGLLENAPPDLVFVDIRMPLCDGLEVVRRANRRYTGIQWVIVSGYTEFEYAKEAVRLGVIDYLVKPVEPEDLTRILGKADEAMKARFREESARWEQACLELAATDPELGSFGGTMCSGGDRVLLCRVDLEGAIDGESEGRLLERLRGGLSAFRRNGCRAVAVPLDPSTVLAVCVMDVRDADPSRADAFKRAVKTILRGSLGTEGRIRWNLCAEGFVPPDGVRNAFAALKRRSRLRFAAGGDCEVLPVTGTAEEDLLSEIGECAVKIADDVLSEDRSSRSEDLERLEGLFRRLPERRGRPAFAGIRAYLAFRIAGRRRELEGASDPGELRELLERIAEESRSSLHGRDTGDRILEYVERHYREDIGVNTVAYRFDLTPSYVSSLFKKRTGTTFVRYLAELRIREAGDLLLHQPELPLREVSARVGYPNPRYFSKMFRRYAGVYPSEYRRGLNS